MTAQFCELRRQRVAVRMHEAIQEFEESLRATREALADDVPADAEALLGARRYPANAATTWDNGSDTSSHTRTHLSRSMSEWPSRGNTSTQSAGLDVDAGVHVKRPPSPLAIYDYGAISTRPRSMVAQRSRPSGEPLRPKHRQNTGGFYFPGTDFKRGPYGFSLLDPILMPPRSWSLSRAPPERWPGDAGDIRPRGAEGPVLRAPASPSMPDCIRPSRAQEERSRVVAATLDRNCEDAVIEQAIFERGVFDGQWQDPQLRLGTFGLQEAVSPERLRVERGRHAEHLASRILSGLESALGEYKGKISHLLRAENQGTPGVLEPSEFLRGLARLGIIREGECGIEGIVDVMVLLDPTFDGRVYFQSLAKAISSAEASRKQVAEASQTWQRRHKSRTSVRYGGPLPVDIVKVEREPRSLYDFERSVEHFRQQQKDLLMLNHELAH